MWSALQTWSAKHLDSIGTTQLGIAAFSLHVRTCPCVFCARACVYVCAYMTCMNEEWRGWWWRQWAISESRERWSTISPWCFKLVSYQFIPFCRNNRSLRNQNCTWLDKQFYANNEAKLISRSWFFHLLLVSFTGLWPCCGTTWKNFVEQIDLSTKSTSYFINHFSRTVTLRIRKWAYTVGRQRQARGQRTSNWSSHSTKFIDCALVDPKF